jgi:hypothetical protein
MRVCSEISGFPPVKIGIYGRDNKEFGGKNEHKILY